MTWIPFDIPATRGVFCHRTLNLRSIQAIGYDMDYTLIHYNVEAWEGRAFDYLKQRLLEQGWPVEEVTFDPTQAIRGLVIDRKLGNLLKINRYGYIKQASHGLQILDYDALRSTYRRTIVDLGEPRYYFLNTLFSISEASMYMQLVVLLDQQKLPGMMNYSDLLDAVRSNLDMTHLEGELKKEIMSNPEEFVELDAAIPQTLLDQKEAGKKILLITNSEWYYTKAMMEYAFDPFLPNGMKWDDLFELVVVSARKPAFFAERAPMFKIIDDDGKLLPCVGTPTERGKYLGGNANIIEDYLNMRGDQILYVGDHIFSDVNVSKSILRWRTALVVRELEAEIEALEQAYRLQEDISQKMRRKESLGYRLSHYRLALQRQRTGHPMGLLAELPVPFEPEIERLQNELRALDDEIRPLLLKDGKQFNDRWGYLMWAGKDKSHLIHQVSKYADLYMSRVSNFLPYTPFAYFRSPRGNPPHDLSNIYQMPPAQECE